MTDPLWQEALALYAHGEYAQACAKFEAWITDAAQKQVHSAEAYRNLALCYQKQEWWDKSVGALFDGLSTSGAPWTRMAIVQDLRATEDRLGIKETVLHEPLQQTALALSPNTLLVSASIAFWVAVLPLFAVLVAKTKQKIFCWSLFSVGVFSLLGSLTLWGLQTMAPQMAVLTSPNRELKEVTVYSKAAVAEENKLIALPRGTVVTTRDLSGELAAIDSPIVGWVPKDSLLLKSGFRPVQPE